MAERRMFAKSVVQSAKFLKLPLSAQTLYFQLGVSADDEGIVEAFPIMRMVGASEDDLKVLTIKEFLKILNDDLVSYIMDWKTNNTIRSDRFHKSRYSHLLLQINTPNTNDDNQAETTCQPNDNQAETEDKLVKDSIDYNTPSISPPAPQGDETPKKEKAEKKVFGSEFHNVRLTDDEYRKLVERLGKDSATDYIERLDGWLAEGHRKKSHYATILNWWRKDNNEPKESTSPQGFVPSRQNIVKASNSFKPSRR